MSRLVLEMREGKVLQEEEEGRKEGQRFDRMTAGG